MDYTTLHAAAVELQQRWLPAKVEQAMQVDAGTAALRLRTLDDAAWLHICWSGPQSCISMGPPPEHGSVGEAFGFGRQLQQELRGLVLVEVELPQRFERVVRLALAERPGGEPQRLLYHEVQGRYSNLVLCSGQGDVLAAGHQVRRPRATAALVLPWPAPGGPDAAAAVAAERQPQLPASQVGSKQSSLRQVYVNSVYALPPPAPGVDPDSCASLAEWQRVVTMAAQQLATGPARSRSNGSAGHSPGTLASACVRAFRGCSPSLMQQLCSTAGVPAEAAPADLDAAHWAAVHQQWQRWLERLQSGSFAACRDPASHAYSVVGAHAEPQASTLAMLHDYYSSAASEQQFEGLQQRLQRGVATAVQRLQKKLESLRKQGGDADEHLHTKKLVSGAPGGGAPAVPPSWVAALERRRLTRGGCALQADMLMANVHRWGAPLRLLARPWRKRRGWRREPKRAQHLSC